VAQGRKKGGPVERWSRRIVEVEQRAVQLFRLDFLSLHRIRIHMHLEIHFFLENFELGNVGPREAMGAKARGLASGKRRGAKRGSSPSC